MEQNKLAKPEELYAAGKAGEWDAVLRAFERDPELARKAARLVSTSGSKWTMLHQAAYWGHEAAARALIRHGGKLKAKGGAKKEDGTPADVAQARGHADLSKLLQHALEKGKGNWGPQADVSFNAVASSAFADGVHKEAEEDLRVWYAGGTVEIEKGRGYWADPFGRVLVGWHGTTDPPCGMDGESMCGGTRFSVMNLLKRL